MILVVAALVAVNAVTVNDRPRAETDIRAVLTAQQDAWNRGDLDGFMAGYWDSEELRFASGDTVTSGFKATKDRYFKRYKADGKEMGTLTFCDVTVEVVTPDFALVRGRWRLKYEKAADEPHGLYTLTLKRFTDGWKITTDHTSAAETK
jgi:beta-aspartyl-peptidase (threonine type)